MATTTYKTPGVWVEEIATLPPSVAPVSTAIPAFIGCTQTGHGRDAAGNIVPIVARIDTLLEYQTLFGKEYPNTFTVHTREVNGTRLREVVKVERDDPPYEYLLYHSLSLYFQNGGGRCYVVSIGDYTTPPKTADFTAGLQALEQHDEPTLIVLTDAINLQPDDDYYINLCQQALNQCKKLGDRFAILDVLPDGVSTKSAVDIFRQKVIADDLSYGAAYYPFLQTSLNYSFDEANVAIEPVEAFIATWQRSFGTNGINVRYTGGLSDVPRVKIEVEEGVVNPIFSISPQKLLKITVGKDQKGATVFAAWQKVKNDARGFEIATDYNGSGDIVATSDDGVTLDIVKWQKKFGDDDIDDNGILVGYTGNLAKAPKVKIVEKAVATPTFVISAPDMLEISVGQGHSGNDVVTAWGGVNAADRQGFEITAAGTGKASLKPTAPEGEVLDTGTWQKTFGEKSINVGYTGSLAKIPQVKIVEKAVATPTFDISASKMLTISVGPAHTIKSIVTAWGGLSAADRQGFEITTAGGGSEKVPVTTDDSVALNKQLGPPPPTSATLKQIRSDKTALYNQIKVELSKQRVVLPPSAIIAGIYASVDRNRGVWKAPANVALAGVIGPVFNITTDEQEDLNVDPTAGKSINAIRAFTGKGTLVWGARTLAGNDNEWRYVSVRRLFINIEESTQKASAFAVFEPNDATTWLKVKAMIESYLYGLWEQGALFGATPEAAYFVNVGLGKTMTAQDVLEGRMIVEIGVAAVRPAEFIILRFSHKLLEA